MELSYTIPLQKHLKMETPPPEPNAAPFFCWDVHLLTVQGRKTVLAMNRASRYSLLFYGMNRADWTRLPELVRDEIRAVILREGLSEFEAARYFALGGPLNISTAHGSTLARILATLFFWALCYKLVSLKLMGSLTLPDVVDAVKHLLLFHHEEHFYYLHITLLAYAALPVTRLVVRYADKRLLRYALTLWFLLGILYPTVRTFWPFTLLNGVPVQWRMNMTYASIGYMLLGHCLFVYHPRPNRGLSVLALSTGFLLAFWGTCFASYAEGRPSEHFLEGMGLAMFLAALGGMGLLSDSLSFTNRPKADRFYLKSLLLRLSYAHFLPPSLCAMGSPGRRRAGAADGAADFGADYLLLLCRLFSPVPDSGCPALADIAV